MRKPRGLEPLWRWAYSVRTDFESLCEFHPVLKRNNDLYQLFAAMRRAGLSDGQVAVELYRYGFDKDPDPDRTRRIHQAGGGSNRLFSGRKLDAEDPREWRARHVPGMLAALRCYFPKRRARPDYKLQEMLAEVFGVSRPTIWRDAHRILP